VPARTKTQLRTSRQESRERIIAAATELVRHTSYGALTVDDVMREAGFGRTIFYRHFDDLADLLMRAGREAFGDLLEAERALSEAAAAGSGDDSDVVRAAIEPAVAVYERHGPLMRAIAEAAAAGDEQVAAGRAAWRERFHELVAEVLRATPALADRADADLAETARALNLMNENYLLDAFGREPRVSTETATATLTAIWSALMQRDARG
jgi:TetR/AcrR family transcriptional regulator, ethionamide resistance regulator